MIKLWSDSAGIFFPCTERGETEVSEFDGLTRRRKKTRQMSSDDAVDSSLKLHKHSLEQKYCFSAVQQPTHKHQPRGLKAALCAFTAQRTNTAASM